MKKLLLLLLIAPIVGKSQTLDLPITGVFKTYGANLGQMTVPSGQVWQWVGMSTHNKANVNEYSAIYWQNHFGGYVEKYHLFTGGQNLTVDWGTSSDFSTGGDCQDCYFTFIQYDLTPTENEKLEETTVSLNLPVDSVINIMGNDFAHYSGSFFEVPEGKILQLVGIINPTDAIGVNSDSVELHVSRLQQGQRTYVCEIGYIFSEYSRIGINNDQFHNSFFSFVMYDLGAQNLASNAPKQQEHRFCYLKLFHCQQQTLCCPS